MTGGWLQQLSSFSLFLFRLVQLSEGGEFCSLEAEKETNRLRFFSAFVSGISPVLPTDVACRLLVRRCWAYLDSFLPVHASPKTQKHQKKRVRLCYG